MPQPHKGLRVQVAFRLPPDLRAEVERGADKRGITVNDWMLLAVRAQVEADKSYHRSPAVA